MQTEDRKHTARNRKGENHRIHHHGDNDDEKGGGDSGDDGLIMRVLVVREVSCTS